MDLVTLAFTLTGHIIPYLSYLLKSGDEAAEEAGREMAGESWDAIKALWAKLRPRIEANPTILQAAQDVALAPNDDIKRTLLNMKLGQLLRDDPVLAAEIEDLLDQVESTMEGGYDFLPEHRRQWYRGAIMSDRGNRGWEMPQIMPYGTKGRGELTFRSTDSLTPLFLTTTLSPYLNAIANIQGIINEAQGRESKEVTIKSITQYTPITISFEGIAKAVEIVLSLVVPWRRRLQETMAELQIREKQAEIEIKRALIWEARSKTAKDEAEVSKITAEVEQQRAMAERMLLENERLRVDVQRAKIQMAMEVIAATAPNLPEEDKIAYVIRLLQPLDIVVSSELEISRISIQEEGKI